MAYTLETDDKSKLSYLCWDYLLNHFHEPELYASTVVRVFEKALKQISDKTISSGSLEQLFDVFLHSYVPTRGHKGEIKEDNLDCPLVELGLLRHTGMAQSTIQPGRFESKYAFRREEKAEISQALFAYCLNEYWSSRHDQEQTIPFHLIVVGEGSPGQVFKIPEQDIRKRLFELGENTNGFFTFDDSAAIPSVVRNKEKKEPNLIDIYVSELANA